MADGLVIVGAGGFGREVLDIVEAIERTGQHLGFIGFLDDGDVDELLLERRGARLLGRTTDFAHVANRYVIGIGSPAAKAKVATIIDAAGGRAVTLVHPIATIGGDSTLGDGCILAAGARVTTNIRLKRHVHVHVNATIGHDTAVGDFASVLPGATVGGQASVGAQVLIGTGANILNGLNVGSHSTVGAGAVVIRDVADKSTVAGVPARDLAT